MNSKTKRLTTTGVLIALGTILSMIEVYKLPFGGSITLAGMVPVVIIGYKYGIKWGFFSGVVFGVIQAILGATSSQAFAGMYDPKNAAKSVFNIVLMALLDYIIAFSVLGLSGIFKNRIKNDTVALALGAGCACFFRFIAHFLSGWILWGSYAEWFFTEQMNNSFGKNVLSKFSGQGLSVIYSAVYNGSYMLPEIIITVIVCVILISVKPLKKIIITEE
ncbi:MAG: energy-coupled thiamine transporter ThiT [Eubacterium sp.]|nr:energy-coupled thiamine transporter ThiT [Eubacterium sp.]